MTLSKADIYKVITRDCWSVPKIFVILALLSALMAVGPMARPASAAPADGYLQHQRIVIDHNKVAGPSALTNFPVLVSFTDARFKTSANGGVVRNSSGYDMIFTDDTQSTKLDHEIVKYVATTGEVVMWVRVPSVSNTVDTGIWLSFGNAAVSTSQENKSGLWSTSYRAVYHLNNNCSSTGCITDSTANANHATPLADYGTPANGNLYTSAGKLAGAQAFNGVLNAVKGPNSASVDLGNQNSLTLSAWVKRGTPTAQGAIVTHGTGGSGGYTMEVGGSPCGPNQVKATKYGVIDICLGTVPQDTNWHYIVETGSASGVDVYVDGVLSGHSPNTDPWLPRSIRPLNLGYATDAPMLGAIEEARVNDATRTAGWIATEYNNQNSPSTFASFTAVAAGLTALADVAPTFSFSVGSQPSACNGETNFTSSAGTADAVTLGHVVGTAVVSGGQSLTVASNAGGGFAVYLTGSRSSQNLRSASHDWVDVVGLYGSPSPLGSGERFGYTYNDSTPSSSVTDPAASTFVALTSSSDAVMGSSVSSSGSGCVGYSLQAAGTTPAGTYSASVVYSAVPSY